MQVRESFVMLSKSLAFAAGALILLSSCGGGDLAESDDVAPPTPINGVPSVPPDRTAVELRSERYDWVGKGRSYSYSRQNAVITFKVEGTRLKVSVLGDESWYAEFKVPDSHARFKPGTHANVYIAPYFGPDAAMDWGPAGCQSREGSFRIHSVTYIDSKLAGIDLSFEQRCDGSPHQLYGRVVWSATDVTKPPGPVRPVPNLWRAPEAVVPASGSYVYLQSEWPDFIGKGKHHLYTRQNSAMKMTQPGPGDVSFSVNGYEWWTGRFIAMNSVPRLVRGYYGPLSAFLFRNPARANMDWSGEHRGCNTREGWFVVDDVEYSGTAITRLEVRFEQHCEGAEAALRGQLRWDASDTSVPPGPVPPPATLWSPAPGSTPQAGNFVYLESDPGDPVGMGFVNTYQSSVQVYGVGRRLTVSASSDSGDGSTGEFGAMSTIPRLRAGFYPDAQWTTSQNSAKPLLRWWAASGCNWILGWFTIDHIARDADGQVTALDARFQQYCEGNWASLRGQVHWVKP